MFGELLYFCESPVFIRRSPDGETLQPICSEDKVTSPLTLGPWVCLQ